MDMFPTIAELLDLPAEDWVEPQDGVSLAKLFRGEESRRRDRPIPFHCFHQTALLDYPYKLIESAEPGRAVSHELYHLENDFGESDNLFDREEEAAVASRLRARMEAWQGSMRASVEGADYPEGRVLPGEPEPRFWMGEKAYRPYLDQWRQRPEYGERLRRFRGNR